jgi:transposase
VKLCPKLTQKQIQELSDFARNKDHEVKEVRRAQAIILLDQGIQIALITSTTGYHRRQIFKVRKKYLEKGINGITTKRKGKPKELLTKKQLQEITKIVKEHDSPLRFGYQSKFWTTAILADFIQKTYKVKYKSKTSYYIIFKRVKFTYHKPGRVWERQNPETIRKWKKNNQPKLKKAWHDTNTVILCEDEMKLSTQTTFQKIWLPIGEYPKVEVSNIKKSKSIYGFLNLKTGQEHAFIAVWQNMYITKEMLIKIRKIYPSQKILLLWDGPGSHRGREVTDFIKADSNIEVIFFPPYTPELNPQEDVWNKGREQVTHNQFIPDVEKTANDFVSYLNNTQFPYSLLGFSAKS